MLKFLKCLRLSLFAIFFILANIVLILIIGELCRNEGSLSRIIPRIKYTISDIDLLLPSNDYHRKRRYVLWNNRGYVGQLDKLKSLKDGYVVSASDFESKNSNNIFSDWNQIYNSKDYETLFYLLIYGNLSATQKQAIIDFYKTGDKASYYIAKEICKIDDPKSDEEFAEIKAYIEEINCNVGFPEWWLMSISEQREYRESRGAEFLKSKEEKD